MPPRLDSEQKTLDLSVNDLLDARLLRHLGFANRGGYERLWLGQAIHSRYQEQALQGDTSYRREVVVRHVFPHRGWEVSVHGRIDGLRRDPDGSLVVEEIKSVRRDGQLTPAARELYERQAMLYAWMLAGQEAAETVIRAELVLIEIGSDAVERRPVELDLRSLEIAVKRRVGAILLAHQQQSSARARRRQAAAEMAFPFPELRRGQQEILDTVTRSLEQREHLLLEAPTGLGKTVATLYPALRYCLAHDKRLFVLTAKTLQQEMVGRVLRLLNQAESFHSLRLRAKRKMCANDQVVCHEEYCAYARDYYLKLQTTGVLGRLLDNHATLDPDTIYAAARKDEVCPFEVSLELQHEVQVTVCDYNYAFEPYVSLSDFAEDADLSDTVLVIDEIHNLVGRGRGYYSPELAAETVRRTAEAMRWGGDPVHYEIQDLCLELAALIDRTVEDALEDGPADRKAAEVVLPESALWRLRPAFDAAFIDYLEWQRETKSLKAEDPFVTLYFDFLRFLNVLLLSDEAFSHCAERRDGPAPSDEAEGGSLFGGGFEGSTLFGGGNVLKILCKDPSRFLGKILNRAHAVIGLSATLSPPDFYRDLLGFDAQRTAVLSVPSPFPPEQRRIVIDSTVATTYKERPANYPRIADRLARFGDAVPGNCLALFPSYAFLAAVASRLPPGSKRVLIQRRADGDRERQEMLETLRSAVLGDVLLLAVAGGVFAEGVDYPGDMLRAVAVVGPCLPAVSLEQELLREYYEQRFEKGFEYAFIVPGMTRVVQAAGRLIRSPEDSGIIALFDKRFLHRPYRHHLPADWLPEDGPRRLVAEPAEAAEEFFLAREQPS